MEKPKERFILCRAARMASQIAPQYLLTSYVSKLPDTSANTKRMRNGMRLYCDLHYSSIAYSNFWQAITDLIFWEDFG